MESINNISFKGLKSSNKKKFPKRRYANKGALRASYAANIIADSSGLATLLILKQSKKISTLNQEDLIQLRKATQEGLKQSGLYEKGVRVFHFEDTEIPKPKEIFSNIKNAFKDEITTDKEFDLKILFEKILGVKYTKADRKALRALREETVKLTSQKQDGLFKKILSKSKNFEQLSFDEIEQGTDSFKNIVLDSASLTQGLVYKTGNNSAYLPETKKIIMPSKSLQTTVFREMGHALNANSSQALKNLMKSSRIVSAIVPGIILTIALLNKRKTTEEKSNSKIQNIKDIIKKNAGKLTLLSMLPVVLEEGIASFRGNNIAKNLVKQGILSKETFKKVKISNALALSSYILTAAATSIGAAVAVKIKDKIQANYEAKKNEKYNLRDAKILKGF